MKTFLLLEDAEIPKSHPRSAAWSQEEKELSSGGKRPVTHVMFAQGLAIDSRGLITVSSDRAGQV